MSLDILLSAFEAILTSYHATLSATTFVLYDIIDNFQDEVAFIWGSKWGVVKAVYIVVRYWALVFLTATFTLSQMHHSDEFCRERYWWFATFGGGAIYVTFVNIIFIIRTYALYDRNPFVLAFFCIVCAVEAGFVAYGTWWSADVTSRFGSKPPIPQWTGCITASAPTRGAQFAWIPCLVTSFLFFVATMLKLWISYLRPSGQIKRFSLSRNVSPIATVFFRDGAFFFLINTVILVLGTVSTALPSATYSASTAPWLCAIYSFSGSQLVLNLRRLASDDPTLVDGLNGTKPIHFKPRSTITGQSTELSAGTSTREYLES